MPAMTGGESIHGMTARNLSIIQITPSHAMSNLQSKVL